MYIIIKLTVESYDMQIMTSFNNLQSAKAHVYDINSHEISYKDDSKRFIKAYKKNYIFSPTLIYIYKILEIPEPIDIKDSIKLESNKNDNIDTAF